MRVLVTVVSMLLLSACANHQQKAQDEGKRYLELSKESIKPLINVKDDPLEAVVTFDTKNVFQQRHGLANVVWNDFFLRGFIDKTTGDRVVQVYAALEHVSGSWLFPYQVNYGKPLTSEPVTKISSDVDCSAKDLWRSCKYNEHVGFTIKQEEVDRLKSVIKNDPTNLFWVFKLKTNSGIDVSDGITKFEFAALFERMDEYIPIETQ